MLVYILLFVVNSFAEEGKLPEPTIFENKNDIEMIPRRYARWCEKPKVTVCRGSGVKQDSVEEAFEFLDTHSPCLYFCRR